MEFVSGYRDEFLDFAALLFGWFRKFATERGAVGASLEGRWRQLETQIRRLPQDPALWVLHVLPNRNVGISLGQGAEPGPGSGLGAAQFLGDEPPLHLRDLSPYVSFVSLEEGEEAEEEEEEEENGEEEGAGLEKVDPDKNGAPAPTSRDSPQEANPPGRPEEPEQQAGGGGGGQDCCREDKAEDEAVPLRAWPGVTDGGLQADIACYAVDTQNEIQTQGPWEKLSRAVVWGPGHQALNPSPPPSAEVTSETFNKEAFLASRGLTRGYWTQLSMLIPGPGTPRHPRGSTPSLSLLLSGSWGSLQARAPQPTGHCPLLLLAAPGNTTPSLVPHIQ